MRSVLVLGLVALVMGALVPGTADAKPRPGVKKGFRLFARAGGALTINRIYCGLQSNGQVCVDSTNSSTIGGGFWPKGTADQYVFNSGIQVAGIIGDDANPEWVGDTTGGQLFSPRGDDHGEEIQPIYNATDPADVAAWPQAARVPQGDATADLYNPLLQGRVSASQGDVWFVSWEGNPAFGAGREHPLGILVEQRGLGYNFPAGNEDILYFVYTFYNATASDPAVYAAAGIRPGMVDVVAEAGARFQTLNEGRFGIDIPDAGYTISSLFAAFGADMDVAEATANYASVNVPFSLGYTYEHSFNPASGWTFDPSIFAAPFFAGSGFVGVKYLKSPEVAGEEVGLTLFSNTINGGAFDDAQNAVQLYRYLSNNISTAAGDAACNTGDPRVTRICYINNAQPQDMRFFQASGPLELAPGQFGSIVVAYIFAPPVSVGGCVGPGTCDLTPGDATRLADAALLASDGANPVDSVSGFAGFDDVNGDGEVQQNEVATVTGSLLNKALVAQNVFDNKFLTPFAPESPNFFLIPGDDRVTVIWQPTSSEVDGDPYFAVASAPTIIPEGSTDPVANPLYDPNYRQLDVEGYRIYRGRVDSPNSLRVIAQFDYSGTVFTDFTSQVNPTTGCAPELGINTITETPNPDDPTVIDTTFGCPVDFDSLVPGVAPTVSVDVPLVGQLTQVRREFGERQALANGEAILLKVDTAFVGAVGGCLAAGGTIATCTLRDTGVPFTFVDEGARNNLRYFYAVTAFDVNSIQSAPSSIESARTAKPITPVAGASNYENTATLTLNVIGRDVVQDSVITAVPALDPATGKFSGPFPPADGGDLHFAGELARQVLAEPGAISVRLDSLTLGSAYDFVPNVYHMTATGGAGAVFQFSIPVTQDQFDVENSNVSFFDAVPVDPALAARYGGNATFALRAEHAQRLAGNYYTNAWGRGCINAAPGFDVGGGCNYNGARWFSGANETQDHPNAGNQANSGGPAVPTNFNNAGALPGVAVIHQDLSYQTTNNIWRHIEGLLGGASRAADFNVYWGEGGTIDSVIDITHNVPVAFSPNVGASWGILNASATGTGSADASATLSAMDMGCVEPLLSSVFVQGTIPCTDAAYQLSQTAVLGPVGYVITGPAMQAGTGQGFILYLPGHFSTFELPPGGTLPAAGTVWTLRTYVGAITGGQGEGGDQGPYAFFEATRPFSAVGAEVRLSFDVVNQVVAATKNDLSRIHTVPDPYYVTSAFEQTTDAKVIKFVNLPAKAIVRIYSSSGVLVSLLEHNSATFGGSEDWNVRNRNNQVVASGVYFYHIEAGDARRVGRFTVVNFAQ
jgi:hypothetical protein